MFSNDTRLAFTKAVESGALGFDSIRGLDSIRLHRFASGEDTLSINEVRLLRDAVEDALAWSAKRPPASIAAFPANLARILREKSLSASGLATMLGVTRQTVSDYLHGRSTPSLETFSTIANVLGVSADELLGKGNNRET